MVHITEEWEVPKEGAKKSEPVPAEEVPEPIPEPEKSLSADPDFTDTFSDTLAAYRVQYLPDTAGLQYIRENVLVRVGISRAQIQKLKSSFKEEENFSIVADDNLFYMYQVQEKAEALGLKVVIAEERYLGFLGINNRMKQLYDLEKDSLRGVSWSYIAFNTTRGPKLVTNIVDADIEKVAHYIQKDITPAILLQDSVLWNLPTEMTRKDSISDADFWQFLLDYSKATDQLNQRLFDHPERSYYDYSLTHQQRDRHELSLLLEREANKRGYLFTSGIGDVYFNQSDRFIQERLYLKTSPQMQQFLDIFLLSYEQGYWDEGLLVEPEEIARRIVLWEAFAEKYPDFVRPRYATDEAAYLVALLIEDDVSYNSHFSREGSLINSDFRQSMEFVIEQIPETLSGLKITEFYQLLKRNGFKRTEPVERYWSIYKKERNAAYESSTKERL